MPDNQPKLILASASKARSALLDNAGVAFAIEPANIDEDKIKTTFMESANPDFPSLAATLSIEKAKLVSRSHKGAFIIGADQLLASGPDVLSKPDTVSNARTQLKNLRGKTHELISGVCLVMNDYVIWKYVETASLTMRDFSDAWLEDYLAKSGETILSSVGAFQLENLGAQLFSTIKGDYFTILGLPLLPLLEELRRQQVLSS